MKFKSYNFILYFELRYVTFLLIIISFVRWLLDMCITEITAYNISSFQFQFFFFSLWTKALEQRKQVDVLKTRKRTDIQTFYHVIIFLPFAYLRRVYMSCLFAQEKLEPIWNFC